MTREATHLHRMTLYERLMVRSSTRPVPAVPGVPGKIWRLSSVYTALICLSSFALRVKGRDRVSKGKHTRKVSAQVCTKRAT